MSSPIKRREFLTLLGGAALASPLAARAQERVRRVGVLASGAANDPDYVARVAAFRQGLEKLGWFEGRNVHIDARFAAGRGDQYQALAKELVALKPDAIFAISGPVAVALQKETREIPIVFANASDPIGSGLVGSLARPGGNVTGLLLIEASIAGKWLAMLKEIAPQLARVALMANPKTSPYDYYLREAETLASSLAIELLPSRVETAADIEHVIESIARVPNSGLILPPDATTIRHRDLVVALAARNRLPAVSGFRPFVAAGGLMSYSIDIVDQCGQAASYVDRILRGEKPADLPVQAPTKYETVVNLTTAKALGLTVPPGLLVAADEVIE